MRGAGKRVMIVIEGKELTLCLMEILSDVILEPRPKATFCEGGGGGGQTRANALIGAVHVIYNPRFGAAG